MDPSSQEYDPFFRQAQSFSSCLISFSFSQRPFSFFLDNPLPVTHLPLLLERLFTQSGLSVSRHLSLIPSMIKKRYNILFLRSVSTPQLTSRLRATRGPKPLHVRPAIPPPLLPLKGAFSSFFSTRFRVKIFPPPLFYHEEEG